MATVAPSLSHVMLIGDTAGAIWETLSETGALTVGKLARVVGQPRDLVMQALGWLAREDKVSIKDENRGRVVSLL